MKQIDLHVLDRLNLLGFNGLEKVCCQRILVSLLICFHPQQGDNNETCGRCW